jgi:two-component system, LytTR family, sensor kinase
MISILKKRWVYHKLGWGLWTLILYFNISRTSDTLSPLEVLKIVMGVNLPVISIVYAHFFIKDYYLKKRNYVQYAIGLLLVLLLGFQIDIAYQYIFGETTSEGTLQKLMNFSSILLLTTGFQYFKRGLVNQYYNQELKAKNAEAELQMLKAQLNPHFMFNTLNNIYAVNESDAARGSDMILELSEIMRYHLESTRLKFVTLGEEVKLIQSYINLEKLRLNPVTEVTIDIAPSSTSMKISPLLLLPFVENAFKYGRHPTQKSIVKLTLSTVEQSVFFTMENTIVQNKNVVKTNIGLENTIRRLNLIYPEKHKLEISDFDNKYRVKLRIDVGSD